MYNIILELIDRKNVLKRLVIQTLVLKYRRTTIGYFWSVLNPLLMIGVLSLVFSRLLGKELGEFALFVFAGMIPWNFFNSVVAQSSTSLIYNEGLIKKIYLPKTIFPISTVLALAIDSFLAFCVFIGLGMILGMNTSWYLIFTIPAFLILLVFCIGTSLLVSMATVYFRDLQYIIVLGMQGLFFLTPVIYPVRAIAGGLGNILLLNPLVPIIALFRAPIVDQSMPDLDALVYSILVAVSTLILGLLAYKKNEKNIVFRL